MKLQFKILALSIFLSLSNGPLFAAETFESSKPESQTFFSGLISHLANDIYPQLAESKYVMQLFVSAAAVGLLTSAYLYGKNVGQVQGHTAGRASYERELFGTITGIRHHGRDILFRGLKGETHAERLTTLRNYVAEAMVRYMSSDIRRRAP